MSTLAVTNLKHESATGNNIVLASDGTATFAEIITASKGIAFPATQVSSANANTLDDYEEGSWTPVIAGSSTAGTTTYTKQVGVYTKVGLIVTCIVHLNWTAGTGTGNLIITGLPFAARNSDTYPSPSFYYSNIGFTSGWVPQAYVSPNGSQITLEQTNGGQSQAISFDAAGVIVGTFVYLSN